MELQAMISVGNMQLTPALRSAEFIQALADARERSGVRLALVNAENDVGYDVRMTVPGIAGRPDYILQQHQSIFPTPDLLTRIRLLVG